MSDSEEEGGFGAGDVSEEEGGFGSGGEAAESEGEDGDFGGGDASEDEKDDAYAHSVLVRGVRCSVAHRSIPHHTTPPSVASATLAKFDQRVHR